MAANDFANQFSFTTLLAGRNVVGPERRARPVPAGHDHALPAKPFPIMQLARRNPGGVPVATGKMSPQSAPTLRRRVCSADASGLIGIGLFVLWSWRLPPSPCSSVSPARRV